MGYDIGILYGGREFLILELEMLVILILDLDEVSLPLKSTIGGGIMVMMVCTLLNWHAFFCLDIVSCDAASSL